MQLVGESEDFCETGETTGSASKFDEGFVSNALLLVQVFTTLW